MDSNFSFSVDGVDELVSDLTRLAKVYPDKAGELLKKEARGLRKEVVKNVKKSTTPDSDNKQSLAKASQYKISQVQGFNEKQFVEISAKSPHFHLVEHGHQIIMPASHGIKGQKGMSVPNKNAGQNVGFVQGKHMMADAVKVYERELPNALSNMVDALLEEEGLT